MRVTQIAKVQKIERLNNSRDGNPRFRFHLEDGSTLTTEPDTADAYAVDPPAWEGKSVRLQVEDGTIHRLELDRGGPIRTLVSVDHEPQVDQEQPCGPEVEMCANFSRRGVFRYADWQAHGLPAEYALATFTTYGMADVVNEKNERLRDASYEDREMPVWWRSYVDSYPENKVEPGEYLNLNDETVLHIEWRTDPDDTESRVEQAEETIYEHGSCYYNVSSLDDLETELGTQCAGIDFDRDIFPEAKR